MFATVRLAFRSDANHCSARGVAGTKVVGRVSGARILRMACWSYASIALTSLIAVNPLVAATITWGTIQNATGNPSDVVTVGTLFDAVTGGFTATNPVLNGVTFKRSEDHNPAGGGTAGSTVSSASFLGSSITFTNLAGEAGAPSGAAPPPSYNADYQNILRGGFYQFGSGLNINIPGLTVGQEYLVQLWTTTWDANFPTQFIAGNSSGLMSQSIAGSNPQFVIGTFTADSATQVINAQGNSGSYAVVGSLQVRAVPEPSSALIAFAALCCLSLIRNRRAHMFTLDCR